MTINLFFEGLWAVFFLSSLTLLVPAAGTMLAARTEATPAAFGFVPAAILVAWMRFAGSLSVPSTSVLALAVAAGTVGLIIPVFRRVDIIAVGAGAVIGGVAGLLWWPSLGDHAFPLFTGLPSDGASGLANVAIYMLALMWPVIGTAVVFNYIPSATTLPFRPFMLIGGLVVMGTLLLLIVTGTMPGLTQWLGRQGALTPGGQ